MALSLDTTCGCTRNAQNDCVHTIQMRARANTTATSTIENPVSLPGAPYAAGDPITIEHHDVWREGVVRAIARLDRPQRFGLHWLIRVDFDDPTMCGHECTAVVADDDGYNHTWRNQVRGSQRIVA